MGNPMWVRLRELVAFLGYLGNRNIVGALSSIADACEELELRTAQDVVDKLRS